MGRSGDVALIPVRSEAARFLREEKWSLVEAETTRNPKLAPAEHLRDELARDLDAASLARLPTRWMMLGHVALVRFEPHGVRHEALAAERLGRLIGARTVLALEGAEGELREPRTRLVWGDPTSETVHREHGLAFHLDPARVLWSQGNHAERHRLVRSVGEGEIVVDLFAGIGYFALPLARAGARVIACEKNPVAAQYLRRNVVENGLGGRVDVREGDCRDVAPRGVARRVVLGYFPGTHAFVATAVAALGAEGGTLHYHTTAGEPHAGERAWRELREHPSLAAGPARLVAARRVKSYAPGVSHVVLDVEVPACRRGQAAPSAAALPAARGPLDDQAGGLDS